MPTLQLLQVPLGQDALACDLRYGNATNAEYGEHGSRLRLGARLGFPLFPGF